METFVCICCPSPLAELPCHILQSLVFYLSIEHVVPYNDDACDNAVSDAGIHTQITMMHVITQLALLEYIHR